MQAEDKLISYVILSSFQENDGRRVKNMFVGSRAALDLMSSQAWQLFYMTARSEDSGKDPGTRLMD